MSALAMTLSDTLVLAQRNLMRIPRQPDLLVAYTIQPVMFVLLFVYVFGGAIQTPGFDYVDFLMPGIIAQSIAFGGFTTALGLSDDVRNGFSKIRVSLQVRADAPQEQIAELVQRATARSAVFDMLTGGVPVEVSLAP